CTRKKYICTFGIDVCTRRAEANRQFSHTLTINIIEPNEALRYANHNSVFADEYKVGCEDFLSERDRCFRSRDRSPIKKSEIIPSQYLRTFSIHRNIKNRG